MNSVSHLKLSDIATQAVSTVSPDTPLDEAVRRFAARHVSSLVVVENGRPVGIVTERDLVRLMYTGSADARPVRAVMSAPLLTVPHNLDFSSAQIMMANCGIRHLVLVDEAGALCGLASETDFRRHLGTDLLALIQSLNTVIDQGGKLIHPDLPLAFALETMASCKLDYVIVGRDGVAEGILTERDVPALLAQHLDPHSVRLAEVMSAPLLTISIDASVDEASRCMEQSGFRHLGVVDRSGLFVGVLSQHRMLEKLGMALMGQSRVQLEDRMSMVLEATGVGTWEFDDIRGQLVRSTALNGMMESVSGSTLEAIDSVLQRLKPADRELLVAGLERMRRGEQELLSLDCSIRNGEGKPRWVSIRGKVLERDADGRPVRSAGVAIDISAQKESEALLRQSEARFRDLMEKVPLAIAHLNARQEIVFLNPHFERLFGYTREDLPNLAAWWLLAYPDEEQRNEFRNAWQEKAAMAADGTLQSFERSVTCKDGSRRHIEFSGIVLSDEFLFILTDVSERQRQQAMLEFSNAILERISRGSLLSDVLDFIVRQIQAVEPGIVCSVLLLDEEGQHLRHGAAPDLPLAYSQAIDGARIGPQVGSCGTAAYRGEEVFVGDIASDPLWADYKELALGHGLAACWSSPIKSTVGKVLGTFAVYWRTPRLDVGSNVSLYVAAATALAGVAIESRLRNDELRSRIDELRRWQQATLGREGRVIELKREVNALLARLGEAPRYASVAGSGDAA
ncbi:CBS domain-containing protein [Quatrionicoccus australiensis]|uniref:CBS domain-containing protein n=1 Tax=Quatrionicoccus australiensis TaxID=138118 RepID=UPI001CF8A072|nr:CBS domain-containing protein [Quatrionicoccus australiensis]UCV16504.1 CBS domain-containing protein [Quatrionicoccus australiensis]